MRVSDIDAGKIVIAFATIVAAISIVTWQGGGAEAVRSYAGARLLEGKIPYVDFHSGEGPISLVLHALLAPTLGATPLRLAQAAAMILSGLLLFNILSRKSTRAIGLFGALAYFALCAMFPGIANGADVFAMALLLASAFLSMSEKKERQFFAGAALALSLLTQPIMLVCLVPFAYLAYFGEWKLQWNFARGFAVVAGTFVIFAFLAGELQAFLWQAAIAPFSLAPWQIADWVTDPFGQAQPMKQLAMIGIFAALATLSTHRGLRIFAWAFLAPSLFGMAAHYDADTYTPHPILAAPLFAAGCAALFEVASRANEERGGILFEASLAAKNNGRKRIGDALDWLDTKRVFLVAAACVILLAVNSTGEDMGRAGIPKAQQHYELRAGRDCNCALVVTKVASDAYIYFEINSTYPGKRFYKPTYLDIFAEEKENYWEDVNGNIGKLNLIIFDRGDYNALVSEKPELAKKIGEEFECKAERNWNMACVRKSLAR